MLSGMSWWRQTIAPLLFFFTRAIADVLRIVIRVWWLIILLVGTYYCATLYGFYSVRIFIALLSFFWMVCALRPSVDLKTGTYFLKELRYFPVFCIAAIPLGIVLLFVPLTGIYKIVLWLFILFLLYYTLFLLDGPLCAQYATRRALKMLVATKWQTGIAGFFAASLMVGLVNFGLPLSASYCASVFLLACFITDVYIQHRYEQFDCYV